MRQLIDMPPAVSVKSIIEEHQCRQVKELESLQASSEIKQAMQTVLSVWHSTTFAKHWRRRVYVYQFSTMTLEADLYLAPSDSLASLITLFEAFESLLPGLEWTSTSEASFGRCYSAEYKEISLEFEAHVDQSDSCKVVPVYETKQVRVGTKVVCNG